MKTKYTTQLLKINGIAGMFYTAGQAVDTIVIYGIGAPTVPDSGNLPDAPIIMSYKTDLFVPDYIGFGRSDGQFTPKNCIQTFLKLYQAFTTGCVGENSYDKVNKKLKYKRVIIIGRSLGGTYVPLLPRFNPKITELGILCPVVDSQSCGSVAGEETNQDFLDSMRNDGYHHLYRGILNKNWMSHLENDDDLSPMDNIKHLSQTKLFIGHGQQDKCVHFSKSVKYHQVLQDAFPDCQKQYKLELYSEGDHGPSTTNQAVKDFLSWLKLPNYS